MRGVAKDAVAPEPAPYSIRGCHPWELLRERKGEERSPAAGYAVSEQPGGSRVATMSVRPAMKSPGPERVEAVATLLMFSGDATGDERQSSLFAPTAVSRAAKHTSRSAS